MANKKRKSAARGGEVTAPLSPVVLKRRPILLTIAWTLFVVWAGYLSWVSWIVLRG